MVKVVVKYLINQEAGHQQYLIDSREYFLLDSLLVVASTQDLLVLN